MGNRGRIMPYDFSVWERYSLIQAVQEAVRLGVPYENMSAVITLFQ